jgi:hypothetical protein
MATMKVTIRIVPITTAATMAEATAVTVAGMAVADIRTCAPSNNRFERSRGRVFGEPRRESMLGINQFRLSATQSRVAQPHR